MALSFDKVFTSPIYTFLIGPEKVEFTLHAAAVAHMSAPLSALVNNGMVETREQCAWLKDVDSDTFARFSRFVYTGDYEEAAPDIVLDQSMIGNDVPPCDGAAAPSLGGEVKPVKDDDFADTPILRTIAKTKKKKSKATRIRPVNGFEARVDGFWGDAAASQSITKTNKGGGGRKRYDVVIPNRFVPSRPNEDSSEDYTPVFLCHARLYVFADKYDIAPLQNLSLDKLHTSLCNYTIYPERISDIVELVRFAYGRTLNLDNEPLRALVIQYVASKVESLTDDLEFQDLLRDPGAAAKDLVRLMVQRLSCRDGDAC